MVRDLRRIRGRRRDRNVSAPATRVLSHWICLSCTAVEDNGAPSAARFVGPRVRTDIAPSGETPACRRCGSAKRMVGCYVDAGAVRRLRAVK